MYNFIKKLLAFSLIVFVTGSTAVMPATVSAAESILDKSELSSGIVTVDYTLTDGSVAKVRVTKGNTQYIYDFSDDIRIPLQSGNGDYNIEVLENVSGNKYRKVAEETVNYTTDNGKSVFLQSDEIVNWSSDMKAIKKAQELTKNSKNDSDKIEAIYSYIVKNIKYDTAKAEDVKSGYIPSVDDVFKTKKGICYDYSVLFASMLRSVGVPVKVLMGTSKDVTEYHAWNQVYSKAKKEWIVVDTTLDAGSNKDNLDTIAKNAARYSPERQY